MCVCLSVCACVGVSVCMGVYVCAAQGSLSVALSAKLAVICISRGVEEE